MTADAGLCALTDFYLYRLACREVVLRHAEAAACDLHYRVLAIAVKVAVKSALAGVVVGAQSFRGSCEALVSVFGNRAEAHRREHNRRFELKAGALGGDKLAVRAVVDVFALFAEVSARFHRLAQRVDRRIGDLRGVYEQLVEVHGVIFWRAHRREQHAARFGLRVHVAHKAAVKRRAGLEAVAAFHYLYRVHGADGGAAVANRALAFVRKHHVVLFVERVHAERALPFAQPTAHAPRVEPHYFVFGLKIIDFHLHTSSLANTGSPPRGVHSLSG